MKGSTGCSQSNIQQENRKQTDGTLTEISLIQSFHDKQFPLNIMDKWGRSSLIILLSSVLFGAANLHAVTLQKYTSSW